jgi:hypothetical protein
MEPTAKRPVTYRLPVDILDRVADEANKRDIPLTDFVEEALREKMDRLDSGKDEGWGALAGLPAKDRAIVLKLIDCLRAAPKSKGFRKAVDANFAWLAESAPQK